MRLYTDRARRVRSSGQAALCSGHRRRIGRRSPEQRFLRTRGSSRRGSALVETAFVLPVYFAVILGIIEFGRGMMVMQLVTTSAREAARMAVMEGTTNEEVNDYVRGLVSDAVGLPEEKVDLEITVDPAWGNPDPQDQIANARRRDTVRIEVSVPYADTSFITPRFLVSRSIRSAVTMRHE